MRGVGFVSLMLMLVGASNLQGQSLADNTRPDTARPEYGWVVASTSDLGAARSVAARYESEDAPNVAVVPVVIGKTQMYRVVVGRHRDFETALDSKGDLPEHAPPDTWLAELPAVTTQTAEGEAGDVDGAKEDASASTLETEPGLGTEVTESRPVSDTVAAPGSWAAEATDTRGGRGSARTAPSKSAPQHVELKSDTKSSDIQDLSLLDTIRRDNLTLELGYLSRFDSNIDHNEDDLDSFGMVPAMMAQLRSNRIKPVALLNYHVARHNYSGTDRWDRFSHLLVGVLRQDQEGSFRTETRGEISVAGTSEDRDLSNQYQVAQNLEYRFTDDYRLHVYGTLRWKRFDVISRNEFKPNVGLEFEQKLDNDAELKFEVRWETKIIDNRDSRYKRWTFALDYEVPVSATSELEVFVENRRKLYEFDEIEIEDEDYLRRDFQWKFGVAWTKQLTDRLRFKTDYMFERRDSNNPEKLFDAHLFDVSVYFRL